MSFSFSSIPQYHRQLLSGNTTCRQAVSWYLENIHRQRHLNAMVAVFEAEALQLADELDRRLANGQSLLPLHGVVVSLKDVFCWKDHSVTAASRMLRGFTSAFTSTVVTRLLDAGAIIIGTTNCDEFAMGSTNETSVYGPTLHPVQTDHVPGGSSGGAAVSVKAAMCMAAIGSDTGGSVRQPAGYCGVAGLKPSYGRISRHGLIAYASSFDCPGIMAEQIEDIAAIYNIIAGPDGFDSTAITTKVPEVSLLPEASTLPPKRFAWLTPTLQAQGTDPEISKAIFETFDALKQAGHQVVELPFDLMEYIVPAYYVLTTAEAGSNLSRYDGVRYGYAQPGAAADLTSFYQQNRSQGFGSEVKRRIMLGSFVLSAGYFDAYFTKAQQVRQRIMEETALIFKDFDAILMPVSPSTAPRLGEMNQDPVAMYLADIYTVFANLAGIPAMTVPLYQHSNGLPFGLQVLTNREDEVTLHQVSVYLQHHFTTIPAQ